jgi:signal transduction histidine kinase
MKLMGGRPWRWSERTAWSDPSSAVARESGRNRIWAVLAVLLIVAGIAGTVGGANQVARQNVEKSYQAFQRSSAQVASTLQLAIQHQDDLVVNASGFVVANPAASEAAFRAWANSVHVLDRYPEVLGFGFTVIVPAAELPAFVARVEADPPTVLASDGSVQISPPGPRPFYCLTKLGQIRDVQVATPAGFDWCAAAGLGPARLRARDSGRSAYTPLMTGNNRLLSVAVPVYSGSVPPTTAASRRAAILGWVATESMPKVLLDRALDGHPDTAVAFRYHDDNSDAEFVSGKAPNGARSVTIDLNNGWTVTTFGPVAGGGVFGNGNALAMLIVGVALSVLLGVFVWVLSSGRARALRLVHERTAQLRGTQAELVDTARKAGMAEIAVNVLHNVGNVLNSVNVSANLVGQKVRGSKSAGLRKAVTLIQEHPADLGDFLTIDARGKALPGYLDKLATTLESERTTIDEELLRLMKGIDHIKEIVSAQQSLAGVSGVLEPVEIDELVDDGLRMAGVLGNDEVTVLRDLSDVGPVLLDRHRVLLVLLNLMGNAKHAMKANTGCHELRVRAEVTAGPKGEAMSIIVADNGQGIPAENMARIFVHGFTTSAEGHGFGLHSSALAAVEMGGRLTAHSDGVGSGAVFTLEVPLERESVSL